MDKKEISENNIIYAQATLEFVTVAGEYCKTLENLNDFSIRQFIENTYKISSLLLLKALSLPKPEIEHKQAPQTCITEADWHYIDNAVSKKLGQFVSYTELRTPLEANHPQTMSISECLTDIYQDLKDVTTLYTLASEEVILNALETCKTNFEQFWGPRIIAVLAEFHNLLYGDEDFSEETAYSKDAKPENSNNWADNLFTKE